MHRVYFAPWAWSIALAAALCGVGAMDQADTTRQATQAWRASQARIDASLQAMQAEQGAHERERRKAAAQALCSADMGEALAVWVNDKTIQCLARRGRARHNLEAPL